MKSTHGGVLLLVKLQAEAESNTPRWVFLTFFKLYYKGTKSRNVSHMVSADYHKLEELYGNYILAIFLLVR